VDPGPISIILLSPVYFTRTVYFTRIVLLFSTRYAHTLCFKQTGETDNLIVSWEQSTWLCCMQVPRCCSQSKAWMRHPINCPELSRSLQASPSVVLAFSSSIDKPWFLTEGKTCCCAHHTFCLGFPTTWL
jgi:hypothetical protein